MEEEEYQKIVAFLSGKYIFSPNENLSNLRRKMRKFSLGGSTELGNLYYQQIKEERIRIPTAEASIDIANWKNGEDFHDDKQLIVKNCLVIKITDVENVVKTSHLETGCGGRNRMRYTLQKYYIKNRDNWISKFSRCAICDFRKAEPEDQPFTPIHSSLPFERLQFDFTFLKRKPIFTLIDHFTKYAFATLTTNRSSNNVIEMLKKNVKEISNFGLVKFSLFQSDNGAEFRTEDLEEFINSLGAQLIHGSVRHPQSQGCVERFHHTFKSQLLTLLSQDGITLERAINQSIFIYNTSFHQTVCFIFFLFFFLILT